MAAHPLMRWEHVWACGDELDRVLTVTTIISYWLTGWEEWLFSWFWLVCARGAGLPAAGVFSCVITDSLWCMIGRPQKADGYTWQGASELSACSSLYTPAWYTRDVVSSKNGFARSHANTCSGLHVLKASATLDCLDIQGELILS